jgi:hypothetical protein
MGALKDIVEELSGRSNRQRRDIVKEHLKKLGLQYEEQKFYCFMHSNILVDLPTKNPGQKKIIIASHYDKVEGSPGANDNASAVAVVLGLADALKDMELEVPVTLAFFDMEENYPVYGALNGSMNYVKRNGIDGIKAVLNFELVGEGQVPVFWPLINQSNEYKKQIEDVTRATGTQPYFVEDIIMNAGDHTSFQYTGVPDSICLTLGCQEDAHFLEEAQQIRAEDMKKDVKTLQEFNIRVFYQSVTFRNYHRDTDLPQFINEDSLRLAEKIALGFIKKSRND